MPEILELVQLDRVQSLLRRLPDTTLHGAEIGVKDGRMSAALLFSRPYLTLFMVDRWKIGPKDEPRSDHDECSFASQTDMDRHYEQAIERTQAYHQRRQVMPLESLEAAACVPPHTLYFAFIDADHLYEAVVKDIEAWRHKIKPGGLLCGHDYGRHDKPDFGVTRAVDEWVRSEALELETDAGYTWFVRLPNE